MLTNVLRSIVTSAANRVKGEPTAESIARWIGVDNAEQLEAHLADVVRQCNPSGTPFEELSLPSQLAVGLKAVASGRDQDIAAIKYLLNRRGLHY